MPTLAPQPIQQHLNIAIVVSRFNSEITEKLLTGATERFKELGFNQNEMTIVWVPGAVEIPIAAQRLAHTKKYHAIICLGAVIFGETKHFDYVCQQVSQGCQQVALNHDIPVIFGILTTETMTQAQERAGGTKGNMGCYAVDSACELISVLQQIK